MTLRPEIGLRALALEVAAVLELRTGQRVEVGDAPPPALLEAVPTGHIAMARRDGAVALVLGAPGGRSLDATVQLGSDEGPDDARAVALAAEELRDTAAELARKEPAAEREPRSDSEGGVVLPSPYADSASQVTGPTVAMRDVERPPIDSGDDVEPAPVTAVKATGIDPLIYARIYGGGSTASSAPAMGAGAGAGLCVERHCLMLGAEVPLFSAQGPGELDVRYRYLTFTSGFYSRPLVAGAFSAGVSLGFLTRLGHFSADMGLADEGLDTDLGARGSAELALEMLPGVDAMSELGVDFTIDRHRLGTGDDRVIDRGDRFSPWGQLALRVRP